MDCYGNKDNAQDWQNSTIIFSGSTDSRLISLLPSVNARLDIYQQTINRILQFLREHPEKVQELTVNINDTILALIESTEHEK